MTDPVPTGPASRSRPAQVAKPLSAPYCFGDSPPGFPVPSTRGAQIACVEGDPPERINVALHRDAKGVYRILTEGETAQDSLWLTVPYVLSGYFDGDRHVYYAYSAYAVAWTEDK